MARLGEEPRCPMCNREQAVPDEVFADLTQDSAVTVRCIGCRRLYVVERHVDVHLSARRMEQGDSNTPVVPS